MLDLRRLRVLAEIARTGSFAGAAEALAFSRSAVSQHVAALERQLGVLLFERTRHGARLTPAGTALLAHADRLLRQASAAEAQIAGMAETGERDLRFGSFPTATLAFGAGAADALRTRHARLALSLVDGEPFETMARLAVGELDLGLIFDLDRWPAGRPYDERSPDRSGPVRYVHLFDDPFSLVLPDAHPLASREVVELTDLETEPVAARAPWADDFRALCAAAGLEPRLDFSHRTPDFLAYQASVLSGRHLTLMPELARPALREGVTMRPLRPRFVRHVKVALPRDGEPSSAASDLVTGLIDAATEFGAVGRGGDRASSSSSRPPSRLA